MIREILNGNVTKIVKLNSYIREITIEIKDLFPFKSGQFITLFINETETRPFSIASSPKFLLENKQFKLIIGVNEGTKTDMFIKNLIEGEDIKFRAPFGIFELENTINNINDENLVFGATSTGIAPLISMIEFLKDIKYKGEISLYFGLSDINEIFYKDKFEDYKNYLNFKYKYCISNSDKQTEESDIISYGYISKYIVLNEKSGSICYICGSTKNVISITNYLRENNFNNIYFENYG